MAITSKHPAFKEFVQDWVVMRDTYRGERIVKEKRTDYLPATSGMVKDGMANGQPGAKAYDAYLTRAVFHEFVSDAVESLIGVLHRTPAVIELPPQLEPLREQATSNNETLQQLLRRITEEQLVAGRLGLLLDFPAEETTELVLPHIAVYHTEHITNWDAGRSSPAEMPKLNLVVLDESDYERQEDFEWTLVNKHRVLVLGETAQNEAANAGAKYRVGVFSQEDSFNESALTTPSLRGQELEEIPFVFINTKDLVPDPDDPPLLGLARLSLAIYRGEADYRQHLFMQGQDTLVVIGGISGTDDGEDVRVGAGARIDLPMGADAKYIGVESAGLSEQRSALDKDKEMAAFRSGQLMNSIGQKESGESLHIRVAAQTATLTHIALTAAAGLEKILKIAAVWAGADPEKVSVSPNLEFVGEKMESRTLVELTSARTMGAPISKKTIHNLMAKRGITEMEFEEELKEILKEQEEDLANMPDPNLGVEDDDEELDEDGNPIKPGDKKPEDEEEQEDDSDDDK